jgi:dTDP-4-dehydrorhamnose 3,5-epimerase
MTKVEPTPPLAGAVKDSQSVTADWDVLRDLIEGVALVEVRNVLGDTSHVTEIFRRDWLGEQAEIDQIFQVTLQGHGVTAWHTHLATTDRLFVNHGLAKVVLYDGRPDSATHGQVNEFRLGEIRPGLVVVPPGVWHGVRNLRAEPSTIINVVDRAYTYEDPDHWRLPPDSPKIPYRI